MPRQSSKEKSSETPNISKYQRFENVTIHRSEIKNAPYNPRVIDAHARKKLKEKIKKVGLIGTLTWNRQTGNLVGGHQRLSIIDELEGMQDYTLSVSAVDMDLKMEKEMNVFLNNTSTQGNYDLDLLGDLLKDIDIDIGNLGFDDLELQMMFEGDEALEGFFDEKKEVPQVNDDIEKIEKMKQARKDWKAKAQEKDDAEFYLVVVFQKRAEVDAFCDALSISRAEKYVYGKRFCSLTGIQFQKD